MLDRYVAEDNMVELDIPMSVASKLRYYVYVLIDPRTRWPFYVGKDIGGVFWITSRVNNVHAGLA
jgi:hypothetical protein